MTATMSMSTREGAISGQLPPGPLDFDLILVVEVVCWLLGY
jgi:hypothetical protein